MKTKQTHYTMKSFSTLLHDTAELIEKYFLEFLFATAVPFMFSYIFLWISSGLFINEFNKISNFNQLKELFAWDNRLLYLILILLVTIGFLNILGLIANPIVAVLQKKITIRNIFPTAMKYFGSYLWMLIIMSMIMLLLLIIGHLSVVLISIIVGIISVSLLDSIQIHLVNWIPSSLMMLGSLFFILTPYILIEKNNGAWQAIKTGATFVIHHFWSVLIREILLLISLSVMVFILQFVPLVGSFIAILLTSIILTAYNYIIYKDLTTKS